MVLNSAPLIADYFHPDSILLASMISGMVSQLSQIISNNGMTFIKIHYGNAVAMNFAATLVLVDAVACIFWLKDVFVEKQEKERLSSVASVKS